MKLNFSSSLKQAATALLTVLVLGSILSVFVIFYLSLIEQQSRLSFRSQAWNLAIAVAEAGIEDGLQALDYWTANHRMDQPWVFDGKRYWHTNTLPDGNRYEVSVDIDTDAWHPTLVSRSAVLLPRFAWTAPASSRFAAIGVNPDSTFVSRAVRVKTSRGGLFIKAMVAKHLIDMNGNNLYTDSFDSRDLHHSWFGHYQASTAKDNGDVATNDSVANSIDVGNANIYGHTSTGPGGSVAVGAQGGVGERSWQAVHRGEIQPGWFTDDSNFTFPEITLPYTTGLPLVGPQKVVTTAFSITSSNVTSSTYPNPAPWSGVTVNLLTRTVTSSSYPTVGTYLGTIQTNYNGNSANIKDYTCTLLTGTNYTYAVYLTNIVCITNTYQNVIPTSGDYCVDSLSGNTIVLAPNVRLVIRNGLSMTANDTLVVAPGASLQVWSGGTSCNVGGNGVVNQSGLAENFILFCIPSVTSFTFNGNGEFIGVLCCPEAHVNMEGSGRSVDDFTGALIAESIRMNGHYSFHYDEALGALQGKGRILVTAWDEIR